MKILMIEDDTNIISINREFFEAKDYEVFCALTLNHARFQLEECNPDLILLDVMMPDGSGYYFCTELRQKTNAPIIFLTCKDESENIVKGLFHGGDDYITKPYDLNVLNARVDTQLRRTRVMNDGKIELFPLLINFLTGEAVLDGEHIPLTQKELQLLGCFALNVGKRLSYDEIYGKAWGGSSTGAAHTVAVHVANLRKKLRINDESWFELSNSGTGEYIFSKVRY